MFKMRKVQKGKPQYNLKSKRTNRVSNPKRAYHVMRNFEEIYAGAHTIMKFLVRGTRVQTGEHAVIRMLEKNNVSAY